MAARPPAGALTVDHYEDDWSQLAWVQALGPSDRRRRRRPEAIAALTERYAAYREQPPAARCCRSRPTASCGGERNTSVARTRSARPRCSSCLGALALAAVALRRRSLRDWTGAPARLAEAVIGLAVLIGILEVLGAVGLFELGPIVIAARARAARAGGLAAPTSAGRRHHHEDPRRAAHRAGAARRRHRDRRVGRAHDPVLRRRHPRVRLALVPPPVGGELRADREHRVAAVHRRRVPDAVLSRHRGDAARARDRAARARHAVARPQPGVARADAAGRVLHRPPARRRRRHDDRRGARDGHDDDGLLAGRRRRQRRGRGVLPARGGGAADDRVPSARRARAGGGRGGPGGGTKLTVLAPVLALTVGVVAIAPRGPATARPPRCGSGR